jgi:hypothetical protein
MESLAKAPSESGGQDRNLISLTVTPEPRVREGDQLALSFPPDRLHF